MYSTPLNPHNPHFELASEPHESVKAFLYKYAEQRVDAIIANENFIDDLYVSTYITPFNKLDT